MKSQDLFCELECLTEKSQIFKGIDLQKKWFKNSDKRIVGVYLQKFIEYNSDHFKFLGVTPVIVGIDSAASIYFKTSNFIGTIPLRAPDTGKQIGDLVVSPRYSNATRYEDYIEILNLLKANLAPEVIPSMPLSSGRNFMPPIYLEATKFINLMGELINTSWTKFSRIEKTLNEPAGQVNWSKYISNQHKAENTLKFPCGLNTRSEYHKEFSQVKYVFDICKRDVLSNITPINIRISLRDKLNAIENKLYFLKSEKTNNLDIHSYDSDIVKKLKAQGNKILKNNLHESTAWRVDFAEVFEKFIQHIFNDAAKETGGKILSNYRFSSRNTNTTPWMLNHLEPDAIYQKGNLQIIIDAKYKSHLFNKYDFGEVLKEDHRRDIHQILGYSSFNTVLKKYSFLCYPSNKPELQFITYTNSINQTTNRIGILGIPLNIASLNNVKRIVNDALSAISLQSNPPPGATF